MNSIASIRQEFIRDSAISESVFDTAIRIVGDEEYDELTHEVSARPIEEALGWSRSRGGHHPCYNLVAPQFINEDGTVWQQKILGELFPGKENQKTGRYFAPKGIGDVPYLPPISRDLVETLAAKYGLEPPGKGQLFWDWFKENKSIPLLITEGGKKSLSAISQEVVALSLYGCRCGVDGLAIKESLLPYVQGREVLIAFDMDSKPKARSAVTKGIRSLGTALGSHAKARAKVVTWDLKLGKGIDDLIAGSPDAFHQAIKDAVPFVEWNQSQWGDLSHLIPERRNERYLTAWDLFTGPEVVFLKSPKGSNKTGVQAELVKQAKSKDIPVIVLAHREQLLRDLSQRFGLPYRTEFNSGETRTDQGYCLCIDSLHPHANPAFSPEDWEGCLLIIDEIEQVLSHMLNSETCKDNRVAILETFTELVNVAGYIVGADADLSRRSIDYIRTLREDPLGLGVIVNEYEPPTKKEAVVYESPEALIAHCYEAIGQGKRLLVHTGAAKNESPWGSKNLERLLDTPGLKILRLDADSVADTEHPAFGAVDSINQVLAGYDIVIASPTLETGVSIDLRDHFDEVIAFGSGIQTTDCFCQSLERLRQAVPRHLYIPQRSSQRVGNGSNDPYVLAKNQKRRFSTTLKLLGELDTVSSLEGRNECHASTWAKYGAQSNYGFQNYRAVIRAKLESEGYTLTEAEHNPEAKEHRLIAKAVAEMAYGEECQAIADAPILEQADYERLSKQRAKTSKERYAERKTNLANRYATEDVTPDLIKLDDSRGWHTGLMLHYYLTLGQCFVKSRDRKKVKDLSKNGKAFIPDVNRSTYIIKVECLRLLGVERFLAQDGEVFTSSSLADWFERIKQYRWDIKECLGIAIHPEKDTAISVAQRLLGLLGLRLTCIGNFRIGQGQRERRYRMENLDPDGRTPIFGRWHERDLRREDYQTLPLAA